MKIQPYLDKLNKSQKFKEFSEKNPKAYFSAGFFVLDFVDKKNLHQIDYYNPEENKIMTFMLDGEVEMKKDDLSGKKSPEKISKEINLDLDILKGLVEDEMKNKKQTKKLNKIIATIQSNEGKLIWNLNCITSDMSVIKVHVEDESHSILKFEPINLFDVVKKLK